MKKHIIIPVAILLILTLWFMGGSEDLPEVENSSSGIPQRVISINPAATEILFELGCQGRLVAVSDFCNYPAEVKDFEKVGGATGHNFERIARLAPDLVIFQGAGEDMVKFCRDRNIRTVSINLRNVGEVYDGIKQLGGLLGLEQEAEQICTRISGQFKEIENKVSSAKKKKVFFSFFRTPGSLAGITTVGPKTCLSELLVRAGGVNIFDDVSQDYTVISKESLLKRQPDVVIEPYAIFSDFEKDTSQALKDWGKLDALNAVSNRRIHFIDPDLVLKPGPRVAQAAMELAKIIHPELFSE